MKLLEQDNSIKVLFLTAVNEFSMYAKFKSSVSPMSGKRYYLQKPVDLTKLLQRVDDMVRLWRIPELFLFERNTFRVAYLYEFQSPRYWGKIHLRLFVYQSYESKFDCPTTSWQSKQPLAVWKITYSKRNLPEMVRTIVWQEKESSVTAVPRMVEMVFWIGFSF